MSPSQILPYKIRFENEAAATAQVVIITEQLDANLDWSTFQLGDLGFGSLTVAVPAGLQAFHTRVDYRGTAGVFVDVTASFNTLTGLATWTFISLDPVTLDVPFNPFSGFLPPNQHPPAGEGFVTYTVHARTTLATGTLVNAQATVIFDQNAPINTPAVFNTVDSGPATSSVNPLRPTTAKPRFLVSWAGSDDPGGSGVGFYDVYVSTDAGPFVPWLIGTTATSGHFAGAAGHTYDFYSVATDNVGNRQAPPTAAQATTYVAVPALPRPTLQAPADGGGSLPPAPDAVPPRTDGSTPAVPTGEAASVPAPADAGLVPASLGQPSPLAVSGAGSPPSIAPEAAPGPSPSAPPATAADRATASSPGEEIDLTIAAPADGGWGSPLDDLFASGAPVLFSDRSGDDLAFVMRPPDGI